MSKLVELLPAPLVLASGNSLSPEFVSLVALAAQTGLGLFAVYQLLQISLWRHYGPHGIKYFFGLSMDAYRQLPVLHRLKLVLVALNGTAALLELVPLGSAQLLQPLSLVNVALLACGTLTLLIFLPLHVLEPTRSTVPLASTLLYWLVLSVWFSVCVVQDLFSPHHIISGDRSAGFGRLTLEAFLFVSSWAVLWLQLALWSPSHELLDYYSLNEWSVSESESNIFSLLTVSWIDPVISSVYRTDEVEFDELPSLAPRFTLAEYSLKSLQYLWDLLLNRAKRSTKSKVPVPDSKVGASLFFPLLRLHFGNILLIGVLNIVQTFLSFADPFLLRWFIRFFSEKTNSTTESESGGPPPMIIGYWIASVMFFVSIFKSLLNNQFFLLENSLENSYQTSLTTMIYNKALLLSPTSRKEKSTGEVINNVSTDVQNIKLFFPCILENLTIPIKLVLCVWLLYEVLGQAALSGIITIAIAIPICGAAGLTLIPLFPKFIKYKDERISLLTEVFNSIKSIKLYAWETPMLNRISEIRNDKELGTLKTVGTTISFLMFLWQCIPFFVSVACYSAFAKLYDIPLTPDIIFPALLLFDRLTEPIFAIPGLITMTVTFVTSLGRIRELLLMEEIEHEIEHVHGAKVNPADVAIEIKNGNFTWNKAPEKKFDEEAIEFDGSESTEFALTDINFTARKGQLTCILGRVGSGKSAIFRALLGDLHIQSNKNVSVSVTGSIAYCSQSPWIINGSVKDNILFGCKFNQEFYEKTIEACELLTDFKVLPKGDETLVGEKGISLSGGQKARLSLARAVYSKSDIYLLDDVLSAVDVHVGKKIIWKVLGPKGMIRTKTVVLATNSIPVLHISDYIFMMKDGKIIERGTYNEIMQTGLEASELINHSKSSIEDEFSKEDTPEEPSTTLERVATNDTIGNASMTSNSQFHSYNLENEEESAKGSVKISTMIEFIKACNVWWASAYILLTFVVVLVGFLEKALLTYWANENEKANKTTDSNFYLYVYLSMGIFAACLNLIAYFILWTRCIINGAKYFHHKMIVSVLGAPMRFFDTTPIGRILNRFTLDILMMDLNLPMSFISFFMLILSGLVTFSVIVINLPIMGVILALLLAFYNEIRKYFIPCSRELKRLASVIRSPKMAHFQESIAGIDTIKAYSQEERFRLKNMKNIDNNVQVEFLQFATNRWLSVRLQAISCLFIFIVCIFCLLGIGSKSQVNPSLLGLIMNYALSISTILIAIIRNWASVETDSVAIERVAEYSNLASEETIDEAEKVWVPQEWPVNGDIEFVNYSTRYAKELDNVLTGINIKINGNKRIGIVGRTGAGKSSLTMALFRIIESSGGHIEIDGIDTSKITLSDLRSRLNIIPQDSQTIKGSVRDNLDPFKQHTDEQLWEVLELAHLKKHVKLMKTVPGKNDKIVNLAKKDDDEDTPETDAETDTYQQQQEVNEPFGSVSDAAGTKYALDAIVEEGGSNLSAGQKQLLCLARALLNKSKILILDEATAAVDVQTDKIIQETIRNQFKDRTILVIAHRLETIIDSDRILVLDHGEVAEYGVPTELIKNADGIFHLLCKQGGHLGTDGMFKN